MYRVLAIACVSLAGAGCSMGGANVATGFTDNGANPSSITRIAPSTPSLNLGGGGNSGTRVAALNDQAPKGTFEKAPTGALVDRDYTGTTLDPEFARDLINQYRADNGLKPLKLDPELTAAAKAHSRDLAKWDRISHYGSDGSNPWDRVKRTGYRPRLAAENVGTGQASFEEVLRGWKKSKGHNKNLLLADAEQMGIALVHDPKTEFKAFWTLVFGSKM